MFLAVHASVGAVLGEHLDNSGAAFVGGFLSHFVLDIIPHGDQIIGRRLSQKNGQLTILFLLDLITAFLLLTLMWMLGVITNPVAAYSGALGAVLPDILSGFTQISKGKLWPDFNRFHEWSHGLSGKEICPVNGAIIQLAIFLGSWLVFL